MTPFYDEAGITLFHGDCRDVLWWVGEKLGPQVDLVLADPPYHCTSCDWDRWVDAWPDRVQPSLKPNGSLWSFGTLRMFMERTDEFAGWKLAQDIIWEKHNGSSFHADRFRRVHEQAVHFYRGAWAEVYKNPLTTPTATKRQLRRKRRPQHMGDVGDSAYTSEDGGPLLMRSVIEARSCHGRATNETQKPEAIVRPLLEYSCPPGGLVLDPFAGSGTTLAVAQSLGLRAVGIELREEQCEHAAERLAGGPLFRQGGVG